MNTLKKIAVLVALTVAALGVVAPSAQAAAPTTSQTGSGSLAHPNGWEWG